MDDTSAPNLLIYPHAPQRELRFTDLEEKHVIVLNKFVLTANLQSVSITGEWNAPPYMDLEAKAVQRGLAVLTPEELTPISSAHVAFGGTFTLNVPRQCALIFNTKDTLTGRKYELAFTVHHVGQGLAVGIPWLESAAIPRRVDPSTAWVNVVSQEFSPKKRYLRAAQTQVQTQDPAPAPPPAQVAPIRSANLSKRAKRN